MTLSQSFVDGKTLYLATKLTPAGVMTVTTDPGIDYGRLYLVNDNQVEWIHFTSVTPSGSYFILGGLTRDVNPLTIPMTSDSTGKTWLATQKCIVVAAHDQIFDAFQGGPFASYTSAQLAARANKVLGETFYDTTLGSMVYWNGSSYQSFGTGTFVNATLTSSGGVELGTQGEVDAGTDAGSVGPTVVIPSTFQAGITARIATEAQAEAGTSDTTLMTPLKAQQADSVISILAGENVAAGAPLYLELSDSRVYNADANVNNKCNVIGFAINTATTGNAVYIKTKGILVTTGLTANSDYFLSDTVGTISTAQGTNVVRVGTAISTTQLVIDNRTIVPVDFTIASGTSVDSFANAGTNYIKYKEIVIPESGTYITNCTMANGDGGGGSTDFCRIYKNGVAYGTERSIAGGATTPQTFTENLFFLKGDLIQLYAKMSVSGPGTHTVSLLSIQGLFISPTFAVVNDA